MNRQHVFARIAEAGSWRALAIACAAALFAAPEFLEGSLTLDQSDWRAVFLFLAIVFASVSIALPEGSKTTVVVQEPCPPDDQKGPSS